MTVLALSCALALAAHAEPDSAEAREAFARAFRVALEEAGIELVYDPKLFALTEGDTRIFLSNFYDEYQATAPSDRPAWLAEAARRVGTPAPDLPEDYEEARGQLLIQVDTVAWHSIHALQLTDAEQGILPAWKPIGGGLAVHPVYDLPTRMVHLSESDLDGWGIDLDEAIRQGLANLATLPHCGFDEIEPGVYLSACGDSYDSARMLDERLVGDLKLRGRPVAVPVNRNSLVVTGSRDKKGKATAARLATSLYELPRWISSSPVEWRKGSWRLLPAEGEAGADVAMAHHLTRGTWYAQQGAVLERLSAGLGTDVFVAQYNVGEREGDGATVSWAVWAPLPSFIPQVDEVGITQSIDPPYRYTIVDWDDLVRIAGDELQPMEGLVPPRWIVAGPPSPAVMEQLQEAGRELVTE